MPLPDSSLNLAHYVVQGSASGKVLLFATKKEVPGVFKALALWAARTGVRVSFGWMQPDTAASKDAMAEMKVGGSKCWLHLRVVKLHVLWVHVPEWHVVSLQWHSCMWQRKKSSDGCIEGTGKAFSLVPTPTPTAIYNHHQTPSPPPIATTSATTSATIIHSQRHPAPR